MRFAAVDAGDGVAGRGPGEPRLGEVRAKGRGRLTVTPWPSRRRRVALPGIRHVQTRGARTRGPAPEVVWLSPVVPEPVPSLLAGGVA